MSGTATVSGVISGLDTDTIIQKMISLAKGPQTQLKNQKTADQNKLAAWQDLNTRVLNVQMAASSIATKQSFNKNSVSSSDEDILTATASSDAALGTYYINVSNKAQAHQVAGQAKGASPTPFTSTTADIGTGTLSFKVGDLSNADRDTSNDFTIDIDSNNNTLMGARDAINKANKGVQATIINAGTSSSPSYQLLLTSTSTGKASQFTVDSGSTSLDFSTVTQTGQDAHLSLGSSADSAVSVSKSSNTISDLIPGVTLNLLDSDSSKVLTVQVSRDTSSIKKSIQDFVTAYNDLNSAISKQYVVDTSTNTAGPLMGDWNLQDLQTQLQATATETIAGADKAYSSFAAVGITLDMQGNLQIDDTTLSNALAEAPDKVTSLFTSGMDSDSAYASYVMSTTDTQSSGVDGWNVNVTQAARRAQLTSAFAMSTSGLSSDETIQLGTRGGSLTAIKLTQNMKLSEVVERINSSSATTGVSALATKSDGTISTDASENTYLTLRSLAYGSSSNVVVFSSASNADGNADGSTGIGTTQLSATTPIGEGNITYQALAGLDVQGTINGDEATGIGQVLTAKPVKANQPQEGLGILITADDPMSTTIYFKKGVGTLLRDFLANATSSTGMISQIEDSINDEMTDLDKQISDWDTRLADQQTRIETEFQNMETQLGTLQDQGNYLSSQISAMNSSKSK